MADTGRQAVYAAEIAAYDGTSYELLAPVAELRRVASTVTGAAWWPHGRIEVVPARRDARSSSTRQRGGERPVVRLAGPQMTAATLAHEFAHVLAGLAAGHGPVFRRAHLDLVGFLFGPDEATWLLDGYTAMGLAPGRRTWPPPPAAGGPLAL